MKKNIDLAVVVISCDNYSDIWTYFDFYFNYSVNIKGDGEYDSSNTPTNFDYFGLTTEKVVNKILAKIKL